jgi:hypothetical protein
MVTLKAVRGSEQSIVREVIAGPLCGDGVVWRRPAASWTIVWRPAPLGRRPALVVRDGFPAGVA